MSIPVPTAATTISASTFGAPVANKLNGIQSGLVTGTTDADGFLTVTFPSAYESSPIVVGTRRTASTSARTCHVHSVSATQVVFRNFDDSGALQASVSNIEVMWVALGTLA